MLAAAAVVAGDGPTVILLVSQPEHFHPRPKIRQLLGQGLEGAHLEDVCRVKEAAQGM
jgi:hypothetical protein